MKSGHRHELKTNELAEWMSNFPEWIKENRITIISLLLVVVVAGILSVWRNQNRKVTIKRQLEFTGYLSQLLGGRAQIMSSQAQGKDLSYILLQPANSLANFAQTVKDSRMSAFALIKRAEALRAELHYRLGPVNEQDFAAQISLAKDSYNEAIKKAGSDPSLMAEAKFGLGLCEEELGNFEAARQIYQDVAANPDFEGTVAKTAAKQRLVTMADYKTKIIFMPSAKPKPPAAIQPKIELKPVDINSLPDGVKKSLQSAGRLPADPNRIRNVPVINIEPNLR